MNSSVYKSPPCLATAVYRLYVNEGVSPKGEQREGDNREGSMGGGEEGGQHVIVRERRQGQWRERA